MYGLIYCVQNRINSKRYIGQTINSLKRRMAIHISEAKANKHNNHFHNALNKYGKEEFLWTILSYASDKQTLDNSERHWIKYYDTLENGYNQKEGGGNGKPTEKVKIKQSNAAKKRCAKKNEKKKQIRRMKDLWQDPEFRKMMLDARIKDINGINNNFYGKKHSKESRRKMVIASEEWWDKEDNRKKHKDSLKEYYSTEDNRKKLSEKAKKAWDDPECRKRISEAQRRGWAEKKRKAEEAIQEAS